GVPETMTRNLHRRELLAGAAGFIALRASAARSAPPSRKKALVVLFQRGAVDGLSMLPPIGDKHYYEYRPNIAIAPPGHGDDGAIPLDSTFGLHPALAPLKAHFQAGKLAFVHAVGSPDRTRSHFDAQDFVETGTPGIKSTDDGWLNRFLAQK